MHAIPMCIGTRDPQRSTMEDRELFVVYLVAWLLYVVGIHGYAWWRRFRQRTVVLSHAAPSLDIRGYPGTQYRFLDEYLLVMYRQAVEWQKTV